MQRQCCFITYGARSYFSPPLSFQPCWLVTLVTKPWTGKNKGKRYFLAIYKVCLLSSCTREKSYRMSRIILLADGNSNIEKSLDRNAQTFSILRPSRWYSLTRVRKFPKHRQTDMHLCQLRCPHRENPDSSKAHNFSTVRQKVLALRSTRWSYFMWFCLLFEGWLLNGSGR